MSYYNVSKHINSLCIDQPRSTLIVADYLYKLFSYKGYSSPYRKLSYKSIQKNTTLSISSIKRALKFLTREVKIFILVVGRGENILHFFLGSIFHKEFNISAESIEKKESIFKRITNHLKVYSLNFYRVNKKKFSENSESVLTQSCLTPSQLWTGVKQPLTFDLSGLETVSRPPLKSSLLHKEYILDHNLKSKDINTNAKTIKTIFNGVKNNMKNVAFDFDNFLNNFDKIKLDLESSIEPKSKIKPEPSDTYLNQPKETLTKLDISQVIETINPERQQRDQAQLIKINSCEPAKSKIINKNVALADKLYKLAFFSKIEGTELRYSKIYNLIETETPERVKAAIEKAESLPGIKNIGSYTWSLIKNKEFIIDTSNNSQERLEKQKLDFQPVLKELREYFLEYKAASLGSNMDTIIFQTLAEKIKTIARAKTIEDKTEPTFQVVEKEIIVIMDIMRKYLDINTIKAGIENMIKSKPYLFRDITPEKTVALALKYLNISDPENKNAYQVIKANNKPGMPAEVKQFLAKFGK